MKRFRPKGSFGLIFLLLAIFWSCSKPPQADYVIKSVSLTNVRFTEGFWAERLRTDMAVTIDHVMHESDETKRIKNFELAAAALQGETGQEFLTRYPFDDSDVYKVIEAASYVLMLEPDAALEKRLDVWIDKIRNAQEPDGYLYTARTINASNTPRMAGEERWINLRSSHELYNMGHLYEAAAAHYEATGKQNLLQVALKNANFFVRTFGAEAGQLKSVPGHEEIEIGLVKLFRVTGKKKYLDLAQFFIDERGNAEGHDLYGTYSQDHEPILEQEEAVGHAVRAAYLYSGVTDVAALTGNNGYMEAMQRIWEDVVSSKLYLTGGIGAAGGIEGFGPAYDLPNPSGYAETCATIALALWNWRMFLYYGDGKYMDLFERAIYNAFLSGAGMSGDVFFYPNPLASFGQHERAPWFTCACCPPNVARFLAQMGQFMYGVEGDRIYLNLFASSRADIKTDAGRVVVEQMTAYPWSGDALVRVTPAKPGAFTLLIRIPGWAMGRPLPSDLYRYAGEARDLPSVSVNGETVTFELERGFLPITRNWQKGDVVEISLPMSVRRVLANANVEADIGRVAVERGPLVYAAEWTDNEGRVANLVLEDGSPLVPELRPELLNGVMVIMGEAIATFLEDGKRVIRKQPLTLIPYYAWAHRGPGEMEVWIAREEDKARPAAPPGLSSEAVVSASEGARSLKGVNDQYDPESSNERIGYMHWWPKRDTLEWIQYTFPEPVTVSETSVYWYDDTGSGGCRVPPSWRLLFLEGEEWRPVENLDPYGTAKDIYNRVRFTPVRTTALKIEVQLPEKFSTGIQEWRVK